MVAGVVDVVDVVDEPSVTDPVQPAPEMVAVAPALSFNAAGSVSVNPIALCAGLSVMFWMVNLSCVVPPGAIS